METTILKEEKRECTVCTCTCGVYQAPAVEVVEVKNEQNILGGSAPSFGNGGGWNG